MISIDDILRGDADRELNDREKEILRKIIQLYILKASPIGSRTLAKYIEQDFRLSPATIRNVMADLEELEYISHPHTSAGRIPTDKGYRFYVDSLNGIVNLNENDIISAASGLATGDSETVLRGASRLLGMLSKYLGWVKIPNIIECCVQKIEIIPISSSRIVVVIALDSNIVRTVSLEADFELDSRFIRDITQFINDKISGRTLSFIKDNFADMIKDFSGSDMPVLRLFTESLDKIFADQSAQDRVLMAGTQNLLGHPEFETPESVRSVIELVENEDIVIHLLDKIEDPQGIKVLIGHEMQNDIMNDYSLVLTNYSIGSAIGTIGLIGPKRMNYPKMISIVKTVADLLSKPS